MPNSTYGTALSVTTFDDFSSEYANLIIGQNKILRYLDQLGFVDKLTGGANITKRLMYAENGTFGSIGAYESTDLTPQEPFTAAVYAWKILSGAISLAKLVIFQNSGSQHQISNIWTDLVMAAAQSGALELTRQFWANGLGNGGKDFGGMRHIITTDGTGTVGGIVAGTDTWWKNKFVSTGGSFAASGVDWMNTLRHTCERDNSSIDLVIGDQNFIEAYERACLQQKRIVLANKAAHDLGLDNLEYAGRPAINDPNQTAGYIDMITSKSLNLTLGTPQEYKKTPVVSPVDQDVNTQLLVLYGNVTCSDRSANGNISGVTYP